jgi:hypothetical protein
MITERQVDEVSDRWHDETVERVNASLGSTPDPSSEVVKAGLRELYALYGRLPPPVSAITVYSSPKEMLDKTEEKTTSRIGHTIIDYCTQLRAGCELVMSDNPKPKDAELIAEQEPKIKTLHEFAIAVYDGILTTDEVALVGWPHTYKTDDDGAIHCADGPAVSWPGQDCYYYRGQRVPEEVIMRPDEVTSEMLVELSAEPRRAAYEALGHERVVRILGLEPRDTAVINGLAYELFGTGEESWLRMQSPTLKNGSQPYYVEPTHESCRTCAEARGYRATGELGVEVRYRHER